MVSSINHHGLHRDRSVHPIHSYELIEVDEFDRQGEEAGAVRSVLGEPVANALGLDVSALPLVIVGYDQRKVVHYVSEQRANPASALRPIAVMGIDLAAVDPDLGQLADIILPTRPLMDDLRDDGATLELLADHVKRLPLTPEDPVLTAMQFLHTRGAEIQPIVDADAQIAYRYPLPELILQKGTLETQDILMDLADHGLLAARHLDRVFTCPGCGGYRVVVKELCNQCRSTHLSTQDSIHHFRCGYVAPEADFMREGLASCPKCKDPIQHIGVEYNRPGRFVTCHDCDHWASEPDLAAWCAECDQYHQPGQLHNAHIQEFAITRNGTQVARAGSWDPSVSPRQPSHRPLPVETPTEMSTETSAGTSAEMHTNPADDLANLAATLASQSDKPVDLYQVILLVDTAQLEEEEANELLVDSQRALRGAVRATDIVVHLERNEFLLLLPEGSPQPPPSPQAIENHFRQALGLRLRVTPLGSETLGGADVKDMPDTWA